MADQAVAGTLLAANINEQAITSNVVTTGSGFTAQNGDILVYELWANATQTMSTAYTDTCYYDGAVEDSATDNAAYLLAPVDIPLYVASTPKPLILSQAVRRAAYY
jgi:hypothetical protein